MSLHAVCTALILEHTNSTLLYDIVLLCKTVNVRVQKESLLRQIHEQTQKLREEAREQHEVVKKFMQLRGEKLHRENKIARMQLNAKMIEVGMCTTYEWCPLA